MFTAFAEKYSPDLSEPTRSVNLALIPELESTTGGREFFHKYAGMSFNNGLYRIHEPDSIGKWNSIVSEAFPEYSDRIITFGADWLGRQFALDRGRVVDSELQILLMEPGTGEALEVPESFLGFHESELVLHSDAALSESFFGSWINAGNRGPSLNQCIGYVKPLFLGGDDAVENLELTDMEVYWSLCGQLLERIRSLPRGVPITNISIG